MGGPEETAEAEPSASAIGKVNTRNGHRSRRSLCRAVCNRS